MAVYNWNSIAEVFTMQAVKFGGSPCISFKRGSSYEDISWEDLHTLVRNTGYFLLSKGVRKGEKVAIYAQNCLEWVVADMAALSVGAVTVPVYATNSPEEARYILDNSDSRICFAGTVHHLDNVLKVRKRLGKLREIILFDGMSDRNEVQSLSDAVAEGIKYGNKALYEKRLNAIKPEDIATIIYTSGTSGDPRGVILTHENITENIEQIHDAFGKVIQEGDIFLSILPLSHAFERTAGYYWPIFAGARIAYAENYLSVSRNLIEVRPHFIISVPRLYESFHREILSRAEMSGSMKKLFLRWSFNVAAENAPYVCRNREREGVFALKHRIAEALVFAELREAMGFDRIRCAVSGGGPLSTGDAEFFSGIGVPLLEGFGMTETSPVVCVNRPGMTKPGTVGPPCRDTTVKISELGEILVKGPQVMKGYYKNRDATRHAFTKEGYLKTGDLGYIDDEGFVLISGRIKDIIVTAGGKNIAPQNIEYRLRQSPYIESIALVGDRRKYLTALIIPSIDQLYRWAREKGIEYFSTKDLVTDERVINFISEEIEALSEDFSRAERVRRFKLIDDIWSQETNELTPTLKIKRRVIEEKYAREIADMYPVESYLLQ